MLHKRRERLRQLEEAESAGQAFWTDAFDRTVRTKIVHAARDSISNVYRGDLFLVEARALILRDEGLFDLVGYTDPAQDFLEYVLKAPDDMMPTVIEAFAASLANRPLVHETGAFNSSSMFAALMGVVLREHRISYELIDGEMVAFSSRELHSEVVAPALTLLAGSPALKGAESAYRDALTEISKGASGDAITDAGTALQEALVAMGCDGNALGPLIRSARSNGLIAAHDSPMLEGIEKVLHWVSADRSESGDAHAVKDASIDDAWLIVHVVGALILRLSKGRRA